MNKHAKKAEEFYKKKDYRTAVDFYTKAIEEDDSTADLFAERAMSFYQLKELDNCIEDMNAAQQLEPNNPYRYSSRAFVKNQNGDVDGAIDDYQKAVHLDPEDAIAYNNLGLVLEAKGYMEQAKQSFDKSDKLIGRETRQSSTNLETKETKEDTTAEEIDNPNSNFLLFDAIKSLGDKTYRREFFDFVKNGFKVKDKK